MSERSDRALREKIFDGQDYRPFGEFGAADARSRYVALKEATGFGPTMRVRPVAEGWRQLAVALEESGIETIAGLEPSVIEDLAQQVWVLQPEKSFLSDPKPEPPEPPAPN